MPANLTPEQRLQQIRDRLTRLGSLSNWRARTPELGLWTGDDAMFTFLADAPFAVLFLLTVIADQEQEIRRLKTMERSV